MSQDHRLPQQRFELKYLIEAGITPQIRDFVASYLEVDEYGEGRPNFSYPIHSLYLDSDELKLHHDGVNGTRNRFKLRLRYYDDDPQTPVFFEVKRRADNCILKQRCGVRREAIPLLLAGQLPDPEHIISKEPRHLATLQRFNLLMSLLNAKPKLHNHYLREAWVSPHDNSVRVTFDRHIRAEPFFQPRAVVEMQESAPVFSQFVVLELKFTDRFPGWFQQLVRRFDLMQFSSAKYCEGIEVLGPHRFKEDERVRSRADAIAVNPLPAAVAPRLAPAMQGQAL